MLAMDLRSSIGPGTGPGRHPYCGQQWQHGEYGPMSACCSVQLTFSLGVRIKTIRSGGSSSYSCRATISEMPGLSSQSIELFLWSLSGMTHSPASPMKPV